jgi:large subunit ribosomal protein L5
MHFLTHFYKKNLNYEFINKFIYNNTKQIPKIKKITLNFGCKTTEIKNLTASLLALELITYQKSKFTTTKYPNIVLKLRKGNPVGCKIELRNKKMFYFLENLLNEVFPKIKNFDGLKFNKKLNHNTFSFKIKDNFTFKSIEEHYYLFNKLSELNITILTTTKKRIELNHLIKLFQFPIKNT